MSPFLKVLEEGEEPPDHVAELQRSFTAWVFTTCDFLAKVQDVGPLLEMPESSALELGMNLARISELIIDFSHHLKEKP